MADGTPQTSNTPTTSKPLAAVKRWSYPFKAIDGQEIDNPQTFLNALAKAEDGTYPIGENGLWHGGVHFDRDTGSVLKQDDGVRCIADGEVIAYRIDTKYPTINYTADGRSALYSTGFVLIRHRLELPEAAASTSTDINPATAGAAQNTAAPSPAPNSGTPTPDDQTGGASATPQTESLTFYSLYMHLLDWKTYHADSSLIRPTYWDGPVAAHRVGARATNTHASLPGKVGLNVRNPNNVVIGLALQGAKLKLGAKHPKRKGHRRIDEVVSGEVLEISSTPVNPTIPTAPASNGASQQVPASTPASAPATSMPTSTVPPVEDSGPRYIFVGELDALTTPDPASFDNVLLLTKPHKVAAGTVVGHLGQYGRYEDANELPPAANRPLLHLEVFAGRDLPAFIEKSRARATTFDVAQKTTFVIDRGTKLCLSSASDGVISEGQQVRRLSGAAGGRGVYVRVQKIVTKIVNSAELVNFDKKPKPNGSYEYERQRVLFTGRYFGATDTETVKRKDFRKNPSQYPRREIKMVDSSSTPVWIERSQLASTGSRRSWSRFPLQLTQTNGPTLGMTSTLTRKDISKLPVDKSTVTDEHGATWYMIWVGNNQYTADFGWVCSKGHPGTKWQSPWEWPGFETISESAPPIDLLKRLLAKKELYADAAERTNFKVRADAVNSGGLLAALRNAIDKQGNKNGEIDSSELRKALTVPWLADRLTKLIVNYHSEWSWDASKWNELDSIMLEGGQATWTAEKERISKLIGPFSASGVSTPLSNHMHVVGLISNFLEIEGKVKIEMLKKVFTARSVNVIKLQAFVNDINANIKEYKLDTPLRLTHFFAQIREEAGAIARTVESLDYTPAGLKEQFRYFRNHPDEADTYGRTSQHAANQVAIANRAYSNRDGHGAPSLEEGWKYRGRGLKQLTWKGNYANFQDGYKDLWPDESPDFINNPDLVAETKYAIRSAVWFWLHFKLYLIADKGAQDEHVNSITAVINKNTPSYAERRSHFRGLWNAEVFSSVI